jgi:hypothetical protein
MLSRICNPKYDIRIGTKTIADAIIIVAINRLVILEINATTKPNKASITIIFR